MTRFTILSVHLSVRRLFIEDILVKTLELKSLMFGVSRILIFVEKRKMFGVITYTVYSMIKINQQQTA